MTTLAAVPDQPDHDEPDDEPVTRPAEPVPNRVYMSAQGAALACGVNKKTLMRKAAELKKAGAEQDPETGYWRILPEHLITAGFTPNRYQPRDTTLDATFPTEPMPAAPAPSTTMIELMVAEAELRTARIRIREQEAELQMLREERSTFQARAAAAEAVAQEREYVINDLRLDRKHVVDRLTRSIFMRRRPKELTAGTAL